MSTKTSIKRIALVAVAALGIATFAVAPSQAANGGELTATLDSTGTISSTSAATGIAGADNFVQITVDVAASGANSTRVVATGGTLVSGSSQVTGSGTSAVTVTTGNDVVLNVPTPSVGSIVVKSYQYANGVLGTTAVGTITVTVNAAASGTTYDHSTAYMNTTTGSAATADTSAPTASATASATPRARVTVTQYYSTDTATVVSTSYTKAVVVSVSGAGSVSTQDNGTVTGVNATVAAGSSTNGVSDFYVYSDGRSGAATVTITVNGATVATKSITFLGTTSSLAQASTFASKTYIGVGSTGTLTWNGKDVNGNTSETSPAAFDYAISSNTAVATVSAVDGVATVTGVAPGSATITICNTASCTAATISASATVTITGTTLGSVALSLDKASYAAGELMTLTVTAKDDKGNPLADGTYDLFGTAPVSNVSLTGWTAIPSDNTIAIKGGVKTYTGFYAPLASGKVTIAGTDSLTAANAVSVSATVTSATDAVTTQSTANGKAIDALAKVVSDFVAAQTATNASLADSLDNANSAASDANDAATAAVDAANNATDAADAATAAAQDATEAAKAALEAITALQDQTAAAADSADSATEAANAATDAANAAAEAADAATQAAQDAQAAVAALATQVASLIAGIKAQITTLTNLVVKIQKKVKA